MEADLEDTERRVACKPLSPISRLGIETMSIDAFSDWLVDLVDLTEDHRIWDCFEQFPGIVGCAKTISSRWYALAILCMLYAKYNQASSEIEAIRALFAQRVVDEELKLHC